MIDRFLVLANISTQYVCLCRTLNSLYRSVYDYTYKGYVVCVFYNNINVDGFKIDTTVADNVVLRIFYCKRTLT